MRAQLLVRIDPDLKARLARAARGEGKTTSEVVRELVEGYVRERDPAGQLEALWDRIGRRLRENGYGPADVDRFVAEARRREP
ncbi:ribbon-helix-helix protein, CopG family [Deferrisoma sp.]|nr:MAG: ribbon-helix-helix protein, CopG family [Candidatus Dadabacteria bacterium]